jgi:hypothetical protein
MGKNRKLLSRKWRGEWERIGSYGVGRGEGNGKE